MSSKDSNLLTEIRELMRHLHYSISTKCKETIEPEKKVEDYLTHLA